jgi:hypothetical protein
MGISAFAKSWDVGVQVKAQGVGKNQGQQDKCDQDEDVDLCLIIHGWRSPDIAQGLQSFF